MLRPPGLERALAVRPRRPDRQGHSHRPGDRLPGRDRAAQPPRAPPRRDDDGFPQGSVDLVHVRTVLIHIGERMATLRWMASWLAPGGWLPVEGGRLRPMEVWIDASFG
jgi:hypothetical protein